MLGPGFPGPSWSLFLCLPSERDRALEETLTFSEHYHEPVIPNLPLYSPFLQQESK